jgi:hypothetical protein
VFELACSIGVRWVIPDSYASSCAENTETLSIGEKALTPHKFRPEPCFEKLTGPFVLEAVSEYFANPGKSDETLVEKEC